MESLQDLIGWCVGAHDERPLQRSNRQSMKHIFLVQFDSQQCTSRVSRTYAR